MATIEQAFAEVQDYYYMRYTLCVYVTREEDELLFVYNYKLDEVYLMAEKIRELSFHETEDGIKITVSYEPYK